MHYHTIIIGAGPAGLFLAQQLGRAKKKVLLLEKNQVVGKKLLISGSGQCNFTHGGAIEDFVHCYGDNWKFIKKALMSFDNKATIAFFNQLGVSSHTLENGKVFPKDMSSASICNALLKACKDNDVKIEYERDVTNIGMYDQVYLVETSDQKEYHGDHVVIATGGKSYPKTGSTGSGYVLAEKLGHQLIQPRPSLTYVTIQEKDYATLSGLSFPNVEMTIWREEKKVKAVTGSLLFTHKGVSGPIVLDSTRWIQPGDCLTVNFLHPKQLEEVKAYFVKEIPLGGTEQIGTFLKKTGLARSFIEVILKVVGVEEHTVCARISKVQRDAIIGALTKCTFSVSGLGGFHVAMATAGGVSLKEVNPTTMESRKQKGLYFIGEVLDIDGNTGGYNIQAAFSTAYLCGLKLEKG